MKRFFLSVLTVVLLINLTSVCVLAQSNGCETTVTQQYETYLIRAGGGGSGGGGGGGGSSGGGSGGHSRASNGRGSILSDIINFIFFILFSSGAAIIFRFKLSKYARNTKKLMSLLETKDNAWKYKDIQKQVNDTFYIVQKAWTGLDMQPAQNYMSEELYESFNTKISWMSFRNQRNVLKNIKLLEAVPVSVYDNDDDSLDYVWFYIKGRMVDYMIDTQTNLKISGKTSAESFGEYWQFIRTADGRWVLNKILQKDEADQIIFSE